MNIRFEKIKLNNFMSFETAEVDFNDYKGYSIIKGVNNNLVDNAVSNGAGKSTVFEAVNWCLTGDTLRGNKDVVRLGTDDCSVEVTFTIDGDRYVITRYKGTTSNLTIFINDENKSGKGIRDTAKLLEEYLPDLTASLINTVIILGQGLPMRFTNNSPAGRKEILEKLSKSDFMIEDLKARVEARSAELSTKLRELQDTLVAKNTAKTMFSNTVSSSKNRLENLRDVSDIITDLHNAEDLLKTLQEEVEVSTQTCNNLYNEINSDNDYLMKANNQFNADYNAYKDDYIKKNINPIDDEIKTLSTNAEAIRLEIVRLENVKDACPTCGQKLPGVVKLDTAEQHKKYEEYKVQLSEKQEEKSNLLFTIDSELAKMKSNFGTETQSYYQRLNANKTTYSNLNNSIAIKKSDITKQTNVISSLTKIVNDYETDKKALETAITDNLANIEKVETEILYINDEVEKVNRHIEIINKFNTALKRDFRGYLLKNIIDYINQKAKEYCEYVFGTDKLDFMLDGNNLVVRYCDKEYEALSGGEKQKVDLIVQFALRDMLSKYLNFSSNILVLDEITDNLDAKGCEKIIDFISNKLDDVQDIFIISHRADTLNIPYDNELVVYKDENGVSTIV